MRKRFIIILCLALFLCCCSAAVPATDAEPISSVHGSSAVELETGTDDGSETETEAGSAPASETEIETASTPGSEPETEAEGRRYIKNTKLVHEINDFSYILADGEMAEEDGQSYIFEKSIAPEDRERFIQSQQELLTALGARETFHFFLSDTYMDRSDRENGTAFFLADSVRTWRQILTTIQLLEGDDVNYGHAYAKADHLAEKLGWERDAFEELSEETITELLQKDPGRLNLIYPCFIEPYSTPQQIGLAKTLALRIGRDMDENGGEEEFLANIKVCAGQLEIDCPETSLRFINGGINTPLIIRSQYVDEWITKEFETDYVYLNWDWGSSLSDELNWQKNITEMIRTRKVNDSYMLQAREAMGWDSPERKEVVYYQWGPDKFDGYSGYTDFVRDTINVSTANAIPHEMVHYMHRHSVSSWREITPWCTEALAEHLTWASLDYELTQLDLRAKGEAPKTLEEVREENVDFILRRWVEIEKTPAEVLYSSKEDNYGRYGAYWLISEYLAQEYGEEAAVQLLMNEKVTEKLTGKTLDELVADWDEYTQKLMEKIKQ